MKLASSYFPPIFVQGGGGRGGGGVVVSALLLHAFLQGDETCVPKITVNYSTTLSMYICYLFKGVSFQRNCGIARWEGITR